MVETRGVAEREGKSTEELGLEVWGTDRVIRERERAREQKKAKWLKVQLQVRNMSGTSKKFKISSSDLAAGLGVFFLSVYSSFLLTDMCCSISFNFLEAFNFPLFFPSSAFLPFPTYSWSVVLLYIPGEKGRTNFAPTLEKDPATASGAARQNCSRQCCGPDLGHVAMSGRPSCPARHLQDRPSMNGPPWN